MDDIFYEIDYDLSPIPGVGKFVSKPQKIETQGHDPIRELFYDMRDISRKHRSPLLDYSRYYEKRIKKNNARIFYEQAVFMKDFTDEYPDEAPFSSYFPFYQMMSYEQLRTYFTWRTKVRHGDIRATSVSFAFLYVYELLACVGAKSPDDGLQKLMDFWKGWNSLVFPDAESGKNVLERYMLGWLKDFHIYYELPHSFHEFTEKHGLSDRYPAAAESENSFSLYQSVSKYDISGSVFFSSGNHQLVEDCFLFVMGRLRCVFAEAGVRFDDSIWQPTKKMVPWEPFENALFHPLPNRPDRRVIVSENEIYFCRRDEWSFSSVITSEQGKRFIGYVLKRTEAVLRELTKFKFKLSANINMLNQETVQRLNELGIPLEKTIADAVTEFFREKTKTVVTVDPASLSRIRNEALSTQEALIVESEAPQDVPVDVGGETMPAEGFVSEDEDETKPACDVWNTLWNSLSGEEKEAVKVSLQDGDLKKYADEVGMMLEVLVDGINEKAAEMIGDNLLDEDFAVYEEYRNHLNR